MNRPGKRPAESAGDDNVYKIFPNDLNAERTVFGGLVMGLCGRTALIVAERHTGLTCVTAAIHSLHFISPARAGETLVVHAADNTVDCQINRLQEPALRAMPTYFRWPRPQCGLLRLNTDNPSGCS